MRFTTAIVVLATSAIARAQLSNIPQCSLTCFTTALGGDGCSELTDFACHCQKPGLAAEIVPCINKACDVPDRKDTSAPTTTAAGSIPTPARGSNSTGPGGFWSSPKNSTTISTASPQSASHPAGSPQSASQSAGSPQSVPEYNGASGIAPGAAQMVGSAILLASMVFFV
ncbi:uncharacterized protein N7500_009264 [Penicillium coprophilum]|uniref:uncharacterized protein n=1 Tax=Penicillium coprophilum TaxID=36646 RepID=UPI00239E610D|nr:uncharacterized protein N7500_009264 [Penicillium coprophilum]KAJ5153825.1 hypothetical protein N7500_009264 [Penicillium coprophilum]